MTKFMDSEHYYRAGHYLRWTTVEPKDPQWRTFEERDAFVEEIKSWCAKNSKGRYSWTTPNRYVNFERRKDALLFKLAFG